MGAPIIPGSAENAGNPIVWARTFRLFPEWHAREYANGTWDVIQTTGVSLSPGFDNFEDCYSWLLAEYSEVS